MKQVVVELFVLLLTILLFLIGMTQFHQPSKSGSALPQVIHHSVYNEAHIHENTSLLAFKK